ncbi:MAG: hypothetical protein P8N23_05505 [Methylophilaceae bacterium]|nr:hypothetical protein [Methylophilaceae bacterium]MDG1453222.1 hypothetical protein [Methylophilaceae bacterium]
MCVSRLANALSLYALPRDTLRSEAMCKAVVDNSVGIFRKALLFALLILNQSAFAISSIEMRIGSVDAPVGQLKDTKLHVDLKGKKPKLNLTAAVKPAAAPDFMPFKLVCDTLFSEQLGYIDCFDGKMTSAVMDIPFSLHIAQQVNQISLDMLLNGAKFSDAAGLHAGEGLIGDIQFTANKKQTGWQWRSELNWEKGEVFWQPFYFGDAGSTFSANGFVDAKKIVVNDAGLIVKDVGEIKANATIDAKTKQLTDAAITAKQIDFNGLYTLLLKPTLEKSAFANLNVSGKANWQFQIKNTQPAHFELKLIDADIEDKNGKFSFSHINANIPWDYDVAQNISLAYESGNLLNLPLSSANLKAELNRYALTTPELVLPLLDGALNFKDVSAAWLGKNWFWHLRMDLTPIDLKQFSAALGWPAMAGHISGQVPLVTYANKQLNMDGAMTFNVFDGTVGMSNLRIDDPLGVVTRLYADLTMRKLDLGVLTRTYRFGAIEGKLDGDVKGLELENWKAVRFDASLQTSDDKQNKKISQRAVENITALGGEGTAAALQRTFLRFFDEFNYVKIAISCKLRGDMCEMGGVTSTPDGYIIVEGSGIPAINVNGYNKQVRVSDLLGRIKRITNSNTNVIVN